MAKPSELLERLMLEAEMDINVRPPKELTNKYSQVFPPRGSKYFVFNSSSGLTHCLLMEDQVLLINKTSSLKSFSTYEELVDILRQ